MTRIRSDGGIIGVLNNPTSGSAQGIWSVKEMERAIRSSNWPIYYPVLDKDPYFNQTISLIHADGTNGANNTVYIDSGTYNFNLITAGKPAQGTFTPFSHRGVPYGHYFDGTGDYYRFANNELGFQMGSNNFTCEFWINPVGTGSPQRIINNWGLSTNAAASWEIYTTSTTVGFAGSTAGASNQFICTGTITKNRWQHVAAVRNGNIFSLYVNGVLQQSNTQAITLQTATTATIGSRYNAGSYTEAFSGYLADLRVIKNVAVYTAEFIPPTTQLTANSVTSLLTFQNQDFPLTDNSPNELAATKSGNPSMINYSPLSPTTSYSTSTVGGSSYHNGSTDYYYIANTGFASNNAVQLGSNSFTVECWVYLTDNTPNKMFIDAWNTAQASSWQLYMTASQKVNFFVGGGAILTSTTGLSNNKWYHLAVARNSTTIRMFVNGLLEQSNTNSTNFVPTTPLAIGVQQSTLTNWMDGWIFNPRIIRGVSVYSENFTVPTSPLTSNSITTFLGSSTNAGIIDHTAKSNWITYGAAAISNTQSKFSTTSMSFNGTNSALYTPNTDITSGSITNSTLLNTIVAGEDFTIECWVNTPTPSLAPAVWQNVASAKIIAFFLTDATPSTLYSIVGGPNYNSSGNSLVVRATTNIQTNTWTHVAFVRSGTTITIYVNGTAAGTATNSLGTLSLQVIGAIAQTGAPNNYFFNGYIDDFRITRGIARYTSNFTPSSVAFFDI